MNARSVARICLALSVVALVGSSDAQGQARATVTGRVLDSAENVAVEGAFVRLDGTAHSTFTDSVGVFQFADVPAGRYRLSTEHLMFSNVQTDSIHVPESGNLDVSILVQSEALKLEPVVVLAEPHRRRAWSEGGTRVGVVTREELAQGERESASLGQVLAKSVTGISLQPKQTNDSGRCVEFRSPASLICKPPLVVVDGVRISGATLYLENTPPGQIERLEVLTASEASTFYGTGSGNGVVLVETRRGVRSSGAGRDDPNGVGRTYNWNLEPGDHPWGRALGGAAMGTAAGLALMLGTLGDCSPLNERRRTECVGSKGTLGRIGAFAVPLAGAALGANLMGRTDWSRGEIGKTVLLTTLPMLSGFFFATPHETTELKSDSQKVFGRIVVVVGVPIAATIGDRIFRIFSPKSND